MAQKVRVYLVILYQAELHDVFVLCVDLLSIRTFSNTRSVVLLIIYSYGVSIGCHCLRVDTVVVCVLILLLFAC